MNTKTNFIIFSGQSGTGKSIYMERLRKELEKHGYTVESPNRDVLVRRDLKGDWKTKIFEEVAKNCESRFCLIEVCTADQGIGMEITFQDFFGAVDLFNALTGEADAEELGCERESPSTDLDHLTDGGLYPYRYLALVWLEDGIPTGMSASYCADIPRARDNVQGLFQGNPGFQVLGDFDDRPCADAVIAAKLKLMTERIPEEERASWPD